MCLDFLETAGKTFFFLFYSEKHSCNCNQFFSELNVEKKLQHHKGNSKLGGDVQSKKTSMCKDGNLPVIFF